MAAKILQINYKYDVTGAEYRQAVSPLAGDFAAVDGLRWKVWVVNEANSEAGGIMLFDSESSMQAFLDGPLAAKVSGHPALRDMSVKTFDLMEKETAITHGTI